MREKIGVSNRYRSGTTCFTDKGAGHYTIDTIYSIIYKHSTLGHSDLYRC